MKYVKIYQPNMVIKIRSDIIFIHYLKALENFFRGDHSGLMY